MMKNIRRKAANAINPEKPHTYPFGELKLMTAERENEKYLPVLYERFEKKNGRKPANDKEAWEYNRQDIAKLMEQVERDMES